MRDFEFLPAIEPKNVACLCCGSSHETHLPLDTVLYNGFGGWYITKDGKHFFADEVDKEWEQFKTLAYIEEQAKKSVNHDWRAILSNPLHGAEYQRQRGKWVLIEENLGFA